MSDIVKALWRRHYNPLSWIAQVVFAAILFAGAWYHDWWTIGIALGSVMTCWFWFEEPKHDTSYFAHAVKGHVLWLKERWSAAKVAHVLFSALSVTVVLVAMWENWPAAAVASVALLAVYRVWWVDQRVGFSRLYDAWISPEPVRARPTNRLARYLGSERIRSRLRQNLRGR